MSRSEVSVSLAAEAEFPSVSPTTVAVSVTSVALSARTESPDQSHFELDSSSVLCSDIQPEVEFEFTSPPNTSSTPGLSPSQETPKELDYSPLTSPVCFFSRSPSPFPALCKSEDLVWIHENLKNLISFIRNFISQYNNHFSTEKMKALCMPFRKQTQKTLELLQPSCVLDRKTIQHEFNKCEVESSLLQRTILDLVNSQFIRSRINLN